MLTLMNSGYVAPEIRRRAERISRISRLLLLVCKVTAIARAAEGISAVNKKKSSCCYCFLRNVMLGS